MRIEKNLRFLFVFLTVFLPPIASEAASEADFNAFRIVMIERGCAFKSTQEGQQVQQELGWSDAKFSEVMLRLALRGEFKCTAGCKLVSKFCTKDAQ